MPEAAVARPFIFVLAGVNGAGKSSVGGAMLAEHGLTWFNPDSFARELTAQLGLRVEEANARAWAHGRSQLEAAIANATNYAFETTLGARTIPALLAKAAATHDVVMLFCGLRSPELHIQRVRSRVACGGHDIPDPVLVLEMVKGRLSFPVPDDPGVLETIPEWARPIVQAAIEWRAGSAA